MAFDLASISNEAVARAPRIVLLGVEKIGKTSFACGDRVVDGKIVEYGLNRPVIVSVRGEQGADAIPVPKFPVAQSLDNVIEALASLYTGDHEFGTVVIDSVSALEPLVWADVCQEAGVQSIEAADTARATRRRSQGGVACWTVSTRCARKKAWPAS